MLYMQDGEIRGRNSGMKLDVVYLLASCLYLSVGSSGRAWALPGTVAPVDTSLNTLRLLPLRDKQEENDVWDECGCGLPVPPL